MADKQLETLAYRLKDLSSLRNLFSELNFDFTDKPVNKDNWNDDQKKLVQEARIIAKNGRDTYLKNFNSTIVADFILSKIFYYKSKNKFIWEK